MHTVDNKLQLFKLFARVLAGKQCTNLRSSGAPPFGAQQRGNATKKGTWHRFSRGFFLKRFAVGPKVGHNFFSQTFLAPPGFPAKNPGVSHQKVWFPWVSKDIPNFLAPTPSRGRLPPHPKISGPKSLGLGPFFLPDSYRL